MKTYICILRGINVGGVVIKMEPLRKSFEALNFKNVKSYIQSGNLFFTYPETPLEELQNTITQKIKEDYGYSIHVLVLTKAYVKKVIEENPLTGETAFMHATFLAQNPASDVDISAIEAKKQPDERFVLSERVVYLYCPNGYGKSNLHTNFLESKLKVKGTTRNWKTTNELLRIAEETELA
jgi:uncharacterized protein (DUF1697 family)